MVGSQSFKQAVLRLLRTLGYMNSWVGSAWKLPHDDEEPVEENEREGERSTEMKLTGVLAIVRLAVLFF